MIPKDSYRTTGSREDKEKGRREGGKGGEGEGEGNGIGEGKKDCKDTA